MTSLKRYLAMAGVLLGNGAMGISFSLINANLDSIYKDFGASLLELQWIINIYGILIASTLVSMGRLGDLFGRKKVVLIGLILFILSMLGSGLAPAPIYIIGFMSIYGLAGAILLPLTQAILLHLFPENKHSIANGLWLSVAGLTMAAGPLIGGITLNYLSWRWIFFINIPFGILSLFLTALYVEESRTEGESTHLDGWGILLLFLTIGSFVYGTIQSDQHSLFSTLGIYLTSLICLIALLFVENKAEMPIIREDLFKNKRFVLSSVCGFCMIALLWAGIFLVPLYLQKSLYYSPMKTGVLLLSFMLPLALLSPLFGHLYQKLGARETISFGFLLFFTATILFLRMNNYFSLILTSLILFGFGFAFIWVCSLTVATSTLSRNFAGIAAGTFVTIQEIGGAVGLALAGTAMRSTPLFVAGFDRGIYVMMGLSGLGLLSALFMTNKPKRRDLA